MQLEHSLFIDAPPELVWHVLMDVEQWPAWTPTMNSIVRMEDGPFQLGSSATIKQPGQPQSLWIVTAFEEGSHFMWGTQRTGFRLDAGHDLTGEGAGTVSRVTVATSGALATLLGPLLRRAATSAIATENEGLKAHCEALARAGSSE